MKVHSQLEKAQLENLGADPTGTGLIIGRAWFRTDTLKLRMYDGAVTREFVDLNSSQSLSTKTLADPIITGAIVGTQIATPANPSAGFNKLYPKADNMMYFLNSAGVEKVLIDGSSTQSMSGKSITDPIMLASIIGTQIATPAAPSSGFNKLYPKSDGKWYNQTSAGVETELGAGGGGGINYITFPSGDTGVGTWVISKNTSANAVPDNGFVTSGITGTFATTATTPHRGTASFLWTLGALGEQIAIPFTIDNEDKGKVLQGSLSYSVVSGTYAGNIHAWVYDVTNAVFIQPAPYKLLNTGIIEKFAFEFQSSYNSTSYKLVLHQAVAGTPQVKLDSFTVGPQAKLYGSMISDWVTFTPTGSWTTNTTYDGRYRRVGDSAEIQISLRLAGAPNAVALSLNMPPGLSIDGNKFAAPSGGAGAGDDRTPLGTFVIRDAGSTSFTGRITYTNATTLAVLVQDASATYTRLASVTQTVPMTWAINDEFGATFTVPILGWGSQAVMSNDANTRVISAEIKRATSQQSLPASTFTKLQFQSVVDDTHGAFDAVTNFRYTVQVPGQYEFTPNLHLSGPASSGAVNLYLYKNGVAFTAASDSLLIGQTGGIAVTFKDKAVAGDYYEIYANPTVATALLADNAIQGGSRLSIKQLSGPSQIMASELVEAHYSTAAGQTIESGGSGEVLNFGTKITDSHGAVITGASWKFTAPKDGTYSVKAAVEFAYTTGWAAGEYAILELFKNGVAAEYIAVHYYQGTSYNLFLGGSTDIKLIAGDYIHVNVLQASGVSINLSAAASLNYVSIISR